MCGLARTAKASSVIGETVSLLMFTPLRGPASECISISRGHVGKFRYTWTENRYGQRPSRKPALQASAFAPAAQLARHARGLTPKGGIPKSTYLWLQFCLVALVESPLQPLAYTSSVEPHRLLDQQTKPSSEHFFTQRIHGRAQGALCSFSCLSADHRLFWKHMCRSDVLQSCQEPSARRRWNWLRRRRWLSLR